MGVILTVFPQLPAFSQSLTLGLVQYRMRLTYRERTAAWYADLWTLAGEAIWLGQRVSPGWGLGFGLQPPNLPDGVMLVRGPSDYLRENLGETVNIAFYPTDELPAFIATAETVTVTIP